MRFKIDENLHGDVAEVLQGRGYDAETVYGEGLQGKDDLSVAARCPARGTSAHNDNDVVRLWHECLLDMKTFLSRGE